jgi:hypothetical protein
MPVKNPKTDGNEDLLVADEDLPEDQTAIRHIEVNDRKFKVVATDPYGFWHIELGSAGSLPEVMEGSFTSPLEAENAIKAYMAAKKHKGTNAPTNSIGSK